MCVCILLLVLQNVLPSKKKPESRSLSLRRKRSFCAAHEKEDFLLPFASLLSTKFIIKNKTSDIIAKKCFPSLPLLSSFLRPARTRYEILFPSFSLCFPFFAFFASKRFALRRFVVAVFLSLSQQGNPRWQKYGSSSRDLSRVPFTSPFSRASLRERDSGGFLLFSFILFSRRNEAACDDILPPSATFTGKKTRKR